MTDVTTGQTLRRGHQHRAARDGLLATRDTFSCPNRGRDLAQYRHWQSYLHDLGECEVKHGEVISLVNLYNDEWQPPVAGKIRSRCPRSHHVGTPDKIVSDASGGWYTGFYPDGDGGIGAWIFFHPHLEIVGRDSGVESRHRLVGSEKRSIFPLKN